MFLSWISMASRSTSETLLKTFAKILQIDPFSRQTLALVKRHYFLLTVADEVGHLVRWQQRHVGQDNLCCIFVRHEGVQALIDFLKDSPQSHIFELELRESTVPREGFGRRDDRFCL